MSKLKKSDSFLENSNLKDARNFDDFSDLSGLADLKDLHGSDGLQKKQKSSRNKTLNLSKEECKVYFGRCLDFREFSEETANSSDKIADFSAESANFFCKTEKSPDETENFSVNQQNHQENQQNPQVNKKELSPEQIKDKTICGESLSVMQNLPEEIFDLAIIDPPYNLTKNFAGKKFNQISHNEYKKYTKSWLTELLPLLKPNASFYICCDWKSSIEIAEVLTEFEQNKKIFIRNRITWQREKGRGAKSNWKNSMEDIWFCTLGEEYVFNLEDVKIRRKVIAPYKVDGNPKDWNQTEEGKFRDTCPGNFWDDISIPFWSMAENTAHPTQKPEKLLAKLILASSNNGDFVFDPFLGSGSTSVTAKKLGRHFCGIELSEEYCAWAEKRLEDAEKNKEIQGYANGVFWERNSITEQKKFFSGE